MVADFDTVIAGLGHTGANLKAAEAIVRELEGGAT
jgi:hypothetical protein